MTECVAIVYQLVPYHDARFSAAASRVDLSVVELFGQNQGMVWSRGVARSFPTVSLQLAKGTPAFGLKRRLVDTLEDVNPRVIAVQGWAGAGALDAILWARGRGVRVIVFSESNIYDHPRHAAKEWVKSRVLKLCDAALVGGRDHVSYLEALGFERDRIALGYNAVDNAHFAPLQGAEAAGTAISRPYYLIASRLAPEKNLARGLEAYARYRTVAGAAAWDLRIIGVGPLEAELRARSRALGLDGHAYFEGFKSYEELPAYYHHAGALLHPSAEEPWGLVVNEALAAGLPVIVSNRCGCCCELLRDGVNGFSVDPFDVAGMADRMVELAHGTVDRRVFGRASRALIAKWGPERFAEGFREAFELAQSKPTRPNIIDRTSVWSLAVWK